MAGLNATTLTPDWLGAASYHDHIFSGGGYIPHSHAGDGPSRPATAAEATAIPGAGGDTDSRPGAAVVSLRSFDAADIVSGSVGLAAASAGPQVPRPAAHSWDYPATAAVRHRGGRPAPSPTPPKYG